MDAVWTHDIPPAMGHASGSWDVVVVGGGVVGLATAWHLKNNNPSLRILVLEKEARIATGNTSRSAALYRNLFSSRTSLELSSSSIRYYQTIADAIELNPCGYLWLFSREQWASSSAAIQALQDSSVRFDVWSEAEIRQKLRLSENVQPSPAFPECASAIYGHDCGGLSAMALARHYAERFRAAGGEIRVKSEVVEIVLTGKEHAFAPWADVRATGVRLKDGTELGAGQVLVAADVWSDSLLAKAGIASHISPKKRQLFGIDFRLDELVQSDNVCSGWAPAMILPAGAVYLKPIPERNVLVVGAADGLGRSFGMGDVDAEFIYFERAVAPVLRWYFPNLRVEVPRLKWAGHYAYYTPDRNPVVDGAGNILWASGTSGSGIMKADAIGRIAAAKAEGRDVAVLFDGTPFHVSDLSLSFRNVEHERFVL